MKKIVVIIFVLLIMFIPRNVNAVSITDSSVLGVSDKKVGETVSILFKIKFSDLDKKNPNSLGIWLVGYELIFDDTVFSVTNISSSDWLSSVYKENGKYYVYSEVGPDAVNMCMNGAVYCDDYFVTIDFYIKDTVKTSSKIEMGDIEVGLLDMKDGNKEYTFNDLITISSFSGKSQTINIKQTVSDSSVGSNNQAPTIIVDEKPTTNIKEVVPKNKNENSSNKNNTSTALKSSNNYLKSLDINGYKIDFDKAKNNYEIEVSELINSLELKAVLEDDRASYKIIGADDLAKNSYKATIEVTAENGAKNRYTVSVKVKDEILSSNKKDKNNLKLDTKYLVGGSIILLISFITFIIIHIKTRKIEKALDRL